MTGAAVRLDLPFTGWARVENSPATRVPSHGIDRYGMRYAIDFVPVNAAGRSAPWSWRAVFGTEDPQVFLGFGQPLLAPAGGVVVVVHDGEDDHLARRSQLSLVPYMLGQARRVRSGIEAIAGNHLAIALADGGPYLWLVHARRGSMRVSPGQRVEVGDVVAEIGNSGNSTQPHVHVQVTTTLDWHNALPVRSVFRHRRRSGEVVDAVPVDGEIVASPTSA